MIFSLQSLALKILSFPRIPPVFSTIFEIHNFNFAFFIYYTVFINTFISCDQYYKIFVYSILLIFNVAFESIRIFAVFLTFYFVINKFFLYDF